MSAQQLDVDSVRAIAETARHARQGSGSTPCPRFPPMERDGSAAIDGHIRETKRAAIHPVTQQHLRACHSKIQGASGDHALQSGGRITQGRIGGSRLCGPTAVAGGVEGGALIKGGILKCIRMQRHRCRGNGRRRCTGWKANAGVAYGLLQKLRRVTMSRIVGMNTVGAETLPGERPGCQLRRDRIVIADLRKIVLIANRRLPRCCAQAGIVLHHEKQQYRRLRWRLQ